MSRIRLSERRLDRRFEQAFGSPLPPTDEGRDGLWKQVVAPRLSQAAAEVKASQRAYDAASGNGRRALGYALGLRRAQLAELERLAHWAGYPLKDIEEIDETGESIPV